MNKIFAIIAVATAVSVSALPAFAQQQGSNQAADYALSWGAVGGRSNTYGNSYGNPYGRSYARYGHMHHMRRTHGHVFPSGAYGYAGPNGGTIPQSAIDFQEQGSH